ncbi:MAG TPA: DUF429 domain-containing protein, partial [Acidimicrobiales bacterium]|nr:DUF429 domain-containing protein [Acidimicrobiales bacterium]
TLPYRPLAGVVPCPGGWLVAGAKLQGTTMSPEEPVVLRTFVEVLDTKPAFEIIALGAAVGLPDIPAAGGRQCDREARALLGWPRSGAIISPPARAALAARSYTKARAANGGRLSAVAWARLARLAEIEEVIAPYWQRTVFEVNPELSFHQLNEDAPLLYPKQSQVGIKERTDLVVGRISGMQRIVDARVRGAGVAHRLDAAACLWTARRIAAHAVRRLPEEPVWDAQGLRMEIVR